VVDHGFALAGFDLHASLADVEARAADRARLEQLCRHLLRPAVAQDRLREAVRASFRAPHQSGALPRRAGVPFRLASCSLSAEGSVPAESGTIGESRRSAKRWGHAETDEGFSRGAGTAVRMVVEQAAAHDGDVRNYRRLP
jgi:hypothetical protein